MKSKQIILLVVGFQLFIGYVYWNYVSNLSRPSRFENISTSNLTDMDVEGFWNDLTNGSVPSKGQETSNFTKLSNNATSMTDKIKSNVVSSNLTLDILKSNFPKDVSNDSIDRKESDEQDANEWMHRMELKYLKIKKRIKRVCERYKIQKRESIHKDLFRIDPVNKIATCFHRKSGSTSWIHYFFQMLPNRLKERKKTINNNIDRMDKKILEFWRIPENDKFTKWNENLIAPYTANKYLHNNKFLIFSFVRHPFERLVSAYNDRILNINNYKNDKYVEQVGLKKWYDHDHSFPAFVDLVLNEYKKSCLPENQQSKGSIYQAKSYDSKCEFKLNQHWRPFASKCSFCDLEYDIIGRMETWSDDLNYIVRKKGLEKVLQSEDSDTIHHSTKGKTQETAKVYFSKLTKKQGKDLYNMFHMDFEMFDYDPKPYLNQN